MPPQEPTLSASVSQTFPQADASIDELMEAASDALVAMRYFEAERLALDALLRARRGDCFDAMARIVLPLQEARRQRLDLAFEATRHAASGPARPRIVAVEGQATSSPNLPEQTGSRAVAASPESPRHLMKSAAVRRADVLEPGAWLVQPPMVGADGRDLRSAALAAGIPVAVLCREPTTRAGRCPLVAVGDVVIRTLVDPPADPDAPDLNWFIAGMEALGLAAIAAMGKEQHPVRSVDALLAALDAHPDHELLHQALGDACRRAALTVRPPRSSPRR